VKKDSEFRRTANKNILRKKDLNIFIDTEYVFLFTEGICLTVEIQALY
jgi:hypothetical protein